ncbi:PH domain-containing protein, partial [Cryobacterium sp. 10I1]
SWRMHTFRVSGEVVEVRSGLVFRSNRRARLDRIQGVNIVRPFIPRLFGAAKLEVSVAGQDANVHLAYLGSAAADALRR